MPWVRLDENAMDHPKVGGLSDGAFRLWVQGLAYCQKFLTDGWIAAVPLRGLRAYSAKRTASLVDSGLWQTATDGVHVHDYLDWNDSKEHVLQQRRCSRERMAKLRVGSREVRDPPTPHHTTPRSGSENQNHSMRGSAFDGHRLKVSKRQHALITDELGGMAGYVDLLACYQAWDQELTESGEEFDTLAFVKGKAMELAKAKRRGGAMFAESDPNAVAWLEECRTLHGGACGASLSRHLERMAKAKATA